MEAIAVLRTASAVDTLCWVRDRLNAGEDVEIVQMIYQREGDLAGRVEAAVRNSIEHQVFPMGRSNYHSHLFSIPVLIECDAALDDDALDLTNVLALLMRALRDNGLTGRNGMLLNRIVEHARLSELAPSDLFGLGREMFMCSMAASSGQGRALGGRLRALSDTAEIQAMERAGGGILLTGHLVGCVYSTRAADTQLEGLRHDALMVRMRAILEYALSGPLPVRVRLGQPQPICTAIATARQMYLETLTHDLLAVSHGASDDVRARVTVNYEASLAGEQALQVELLHRNSPMARLEASLSMHEGSALGAILEALKAKSDEYELGAVEVAYATNATRH